MRVTVAIALGSNLGDRESHLEFARSRLCGMLVNRRLSSTYESEPEDVPGPQPSFLNAAIVGETAVVARDFLAELLMLERERGRARPFPGAARTLDLDLVLFGDRIVNEPGLVLPHPRFRERRFVLEPLAEIAPELRDPVTGETIERLLTRCRPAREAPRR